MVLDRPPVTTTRVPLSEFSSSTPGATLRDTNVGLVPDQMGGSWGIPLSSQRDPPRLDLVDGVGSYAWGRPVPRNLEPDEAGVATTDLLP